MWYVVFKTFPFINYLVKNNNTCLKEQNNKTYNLSDWCISKIKSKYKANF